MTGTNEKSCTKLSGFVEEAIKFADKMEEMEDKDEMNATKDGVTKVTKDDRRLDKHEAMTEGKEMEDMAAKATEDNMKVEDMAAKATEDNMKEGFDPSEMALSIWKLMCTSPPPTEMTKKLFDDCDAILNGTLMKTMMAAMTDDDYYEDKEDTSENATKDTATDATTTAAAGVAGAASESAAFSAHVSVVSVAAACVAMVLANFDGRMRKIE
jgi:hypothetical protein